MNNSKPTFQGSTATATGLGVTNEISTFSSPFDNFLHYVPKEHEVAIRQALFNAIAIVVFIILGIGTYYVYIILEPFMLPLFWAILTGFVLHPYKEKLSNWTRETLGELGSPETPVACLVSIRMLADSVVKACDAVGSFIFNKIKVLLGIGLCFLLVLVSSSIESSSWTRLCDNLVSIWTWNPLHWFSGVTLVQVMTLGLVSVTALVFVKQEEAHQVLVVKGSVLMFWILILSYIFNLLWSPLAFISGIIGYFVYTRMEDQPDASEGEEHPESGAIKAVVRKVLSYFVNLDDSSQSLDANTGETVVLEKKAAVVNDVDGKERIKEVNVVASTPNLNPNPPKTIPESEVMAHPSVRALKKQMTPKPDSSIGPTPTLGTSRRFRRHPFRSFHRFKSVSPPPKIKSSYFIRATLISCLVIQFYVRPWFLQLLIVPTLLYLLKQILTFLNILESVKGWGYNLVDKMRIWVQLNKDLLFPAPVQQTWIMYQALEKKILQKLPAYTDPLVTGILIILMIVIVIVLGIFISLELYAESMHMVQMSGKLVTKLAESPALFHVNQTFWDPTYRTNIESFIDTAYHGGRDYISSSLRQFLGETEDRKSAQEIESKILELWDRMYQYWIVRRKEGFGPEVTNEAVSTSFDALVTAVMNERVFSWASIAQFGKDNMSTFMSIVDHTWIILKGNFGLVMTLLLEILKLLLLSSTSVVNFMLSIVIYFTALFYLLVNSGRNYLPVDFLSNYGTLVGSGVGTALDKAINSIFWLTFKMVTFYSCWTYLTHTVFNASIVMVPVVAAAFLAAVPVAGQYFVPLPAALELWLAKGRPISAVLLILGHILPTCVVDGIMYGEVKGGIHPWLTGLSIVGGIYYFGIPGAIYGPLVLVAVFVVFSIYPNTFSNFNVEASKLVATPMLRRSDTVY